MEYFGPESSALCGFSLIEKPRDQNGSVLTFP